MEDDRRARNVSMSLLAIATLLSLACTRGRDLAGTSVQ
jgi:hypothetical protein